MLDDAELTCCLWAQLRHPYVRLLKKLGAGGILVLALKFGYSKALSFAILKLWLLHLSVILMLIVLLLSATLWRSFMRWHCLSFNHQAHDCS